MTRIKLSKRLLAIAEMVDCNILFDVGTDHAYLPCYLLDTNRIKKAYAGDMRILPLEKAKESIKSFNLEDKVIPVLSDGLDKCQDDVDGVTIAGMGSETIVEILKKKDLIHFKQIIVQANRRSDLLRQFISEREYLITDEKVIRDHGHYYEIIAFSPLVKGKRLNKEEIIFGPINQSRREDSYLEYLNERKNKCLKILALSEQEDIKHLLALINQELEKDRY